MFDVYFLVWCPLLILLGMWAGVVVFVVVVAVAVDEDVGIAVMVVVRIAFVGVDVVASMTGIVENNCVVFFVVLELMVCLCCVCNCDSGYGCCVVFRVGCRRRCRCCRLLDRLVA